MKRNMDLIREILLKTEDLCGGGGFYRFEQDDFPDHNEKDVYEHARLLFEAGLLRETRQPLGYSVYVSGLTWQGHDFVNSVRDPKIWRKTKAVGEKAGGWTLEILSDIAKGLIKTKIKKHTGVEI